MNYGHIYQCPRTISKVAKQCLCSTARLYFYLPQLHNVSIKIIVFVKNPPKFYKNYVKSYINNSSMNCTKKCCDLAIISNSAMLYFLRNHLSFSEESCPKNQHVTSKNEGLSISFLRDFLSHFASHLPHFYDLLSEFLHLLS